MPNKYELLTKADIMREYRYPSYQLNEDIRTGAIPYFVIGGIYSSRYYIPRHAVEARIDELTTAQANKVKS